MPELDFALLSDYVRVEGGIAHVIAAGVDTVNTPTTPTGQNFGRGDGIAREHLVADLDDDGEWIVGDVSRLEE